MIRVVLPGSGSWFFTHPGSRIHDPGVKKALDLDHNTGDIYITILGPIPLCDASCERGAHPVGRLPWLGQAHGAHLRQEVQAGVLGAGSAHHASRRGKFPIYRFLSGSVEDSHHLNADSDLAFHLNADPVPDSAPVMGICDHSDL